MKKKYIVSKWRQNNQFYFASFKFWQKFEKLKKKKKTFPKELFKEIWLIIGDIEYINISEATIWFFFYSGGISGAKHFPVPPKTLIYAN